jgi:hypothetical protein
MWVPALLHSPEAVSDTIRPWAAITYMGTTVIVFFLSLFRLLHPGASSQGWSSTARSRPFTR